MRKNWINPELKKLEIYLTESESIQAGQITRDIATGDGTSVIFYWWCTCCGTKSTDGANGAYLEGVHVWGTAEQAITAGKATHGNCGACSA